MPKNAYEWTVVAVLGVAVIGLFRMWLNRKPSSPPYDTHDEPVDKVPNHWWYWDSLPHSDPRRRYHDDRRREEKKQDEKDRARDDAEERRRYGE